MWGGGIIDKSYVPYPYRKEGRGEKLPTECVGRRMAVHTTFGANPRHSHFQTMVLGRRFVDIGEGWALGPHLATGCFPQKAVLSAYRCRILCKVLLVRITVR